jgi:hypothetical protein
VRSYTRPWVGRDRQRRWRRLASDHVRSLVLLVVLLVCLGSTDIRRGPTSCSLRTNGQNPTFVGLARITSTSSYTAGPVVLCSAMRCDQLAQLLDPYDNVISTCSYGETDKALSTPFTSSTPSTPFSYSLRWIVASPWILLTSLTPDRQIRRPAERQAHETVFACGFVFALALLPLFVSSRRFPNLPVWPSFHDDLLRACLQRLAP